MRAIIFILIVAVVVLIGGIATGFLNISQTRQAAVPEISTVGNGVTYHYVVVATNLAGTSPSSPQA